MSYMVEVAKAEDSLVKPELVPRRDVSRARGGLEHPSWF